MINRKNKYQVELENQECYWCGKKATSKEHVPPRNLFPGINDTFLIIVPSCAQHNQHLGMVDERMKYQMLAFSGDVDLNTRELRRLKDRPQSITLYNRIVETLNEANMIVDENGNEYYELKLLYQKDFDKYFEKITRGLMYFETGKRASSNEKITLYSENIGLGKFNGFVKHAEFFKNVSIETAGSWQKCKISLKQFEYFWTTFGELFFLKMIFYENFTMYTCVKFLNFKNDLYVPKEIEEK